MTLSTLNNDVTTLDGLAPKAAGSLIKPVDWNALVSSVHGIGQALQEYITQTNTSITDLQNQVTPLVAQVATLATDVADLKTQIQPLLNQYVVTLRTSKSSYAMGELSEITAEVRDLTGNIVTARPWVDFVTTWGQLQAASGFSTLVSANGGSISVQANAQGIAKVRVKAAHAENLSETQELQVADAMNSSVGNGMVFYQAIMNAPTPSSPEATQAFSQMKVQYQSSSNSSMQLFLDAYQQYPIYHVYPPRGNTTTNWKHYRTVVVAIAKPDSDPTTPDSAKGSASIQVDFRDWIGPWIIDYTHDYQSIVPGLKGSIGSQLGKGSLELDLDTVENIVLGHINPGGPVERQRFYNAMIDVMDQVTPTTPLPYMSDLRGAVKQAVTAQQTQEVPGGALNGNAYSKAPALSALKGASRQAAVAATTAQTARGSVDALQASSQDLNNKVLALDSDLQVSQRLSTTINQQLGSIGQNVLKINTLDQNSVQGQINLITAQIGNINEVLRRG